MIPSLQPVVFRGRLAAAAGASQYFLAPHIEALEQDHPDRLFVSVMTFHASDVLTGRHPGPYSDETAELVARSALIADRDFATEWDLSDADLAERYMVPLDQVQEKRRDLERPERVRTW